MSKKLILAVALSLVIVSGGFYSAQAACGFCFPHISSPCGWFSCSSNSARDKDLGVYNPFPERVHSIGVSGCCGERTDMNTDNGEESMMGSDPSNPAPMPERVFRRIFGRTR